MSIATEMESLVLEQIRKGGPNGVTLDDLVLMTGRDKVTVSPRLKPLETKGMVRRDGKRAGLAHKKQTVWKVA